MRSRAPSLTVGGIANCCSHDGTNLPHDPAVPLFVTCLKDVTFYSTATLLFLFTRARKWEHTKCPSTDEWMRRIRYIYTMECSLALKVQMI